MVPVLSRSGAPSTQERQLPGSAVTRTKAWAPCTGGKGSSSKAMGYPLGSSYVDNIDTLYPATQNGQQTTGQAVGWV